jgi:hypothetical protein
MTAGTNTQVSCPSVPGYTYQLQYSDNLGSVASWINVGSPVAGTGGPIVLVDSGGTTHTTRYYRAQAY